MLRFTLISLPPTDREPPGHMPLFPPSCDMAPRLLAPPPVPNEPATKTQKDDVKMELENASLWKQFSSVGTEMIITKKGRWGNRVKRCVWPLIFDLLIPPYSPLSSVLLHNFPNASVTDNHLSSSPRRMFPGLRLKLSGLNPALRYILLLDIIPVDNSRYRFQGGGWQAVGGAEARLPDRVFIHPDSPATGAHWQSRTISFHYAKLTNNTLDSQGHVSTAEWLTQHRDSTSPPLVDLSINLFLLLLFADHPPLAASLPAQTSCNWSQRCAEVGWRAALLCFPWDPVYHCHRLPEQQGTTILHIY